MDPNATLATIRELVDEHLREGWSGSGPTLDRLDKLAEAFRDMDEWLIAGGFLPTAWTAVRKAGPSFGRAGKAKAKAKQKWEGR